MSSAESRRVRRRNAFLSEHFLEDFRGIPQTFEDAVIQNGSLRQLFKPVLQRPERAEKVSAVHGGDVAGLQGLQALKVVPVQQMTFVALQPGDRFHGAAKGFDDLVSGEYPKSRAARALSIQRPIFVGLVRIAS